MFLPIFMKKGNENLNPLSLHLLVMHMHILSKTLAIFQTNCWLWVLVGLPTPGKLRVLQEWRDLPVPKLTVPLKVQQAKKKKFAVGSSH